LTPTGLPAWQKLAALATNLRDAPLANLVTDGARCKHLSHQLAGCTFDYTKQWVDDTALAELLALADARRVLERARQMFSGETVNETENRPALHSALRGGAPDADNDVKREVAAVQRRMIQCAAAIRSGQWRGFSNKPITDVVHIGIGGSHLGPELVVKALADFKTTDLRILFVANIDAADLQRALRGLNPETTLFIVVSKSFSTLETQVNASSARSWFLERTGSLEAIAQHFIGVTTNLPAALEFGMSQDNLFPIWDWVGGRFSLWSAVGLPILLSIGTENFNALLAGAAEVDRHFATAPPGQNVPLLSALFATWNYNFLGAASLAVLPYDERLRLLPDYLQQLEMESNGKSVTLAGVQVDTHTMPILWGGTGTNGQHAYHQLLHQGTRAFTADFVLVATDSHDAREHHNWLLANALAQSQAMAVGYTADDQPHKAVAGNHPTTTIVLDELGPRQLGAILAVYEHKVFCQGVIWDINSFDQWGVELGKQLAKPIYAELAQEGVTETHANEQQDAATQNLIRHIRTTRDKKNNT